MAEATANMAKVVVLLLLAIQILSVLAGAARPLEGYHGWMDNGIGMVTQILASPSHSNPAGHCC
jgi:hypothetical protein